VQKHLKEVLTAQKELEAMLKKKSSGLSETERKRLEKTKRRGSKKSIGRIKSHAV
jgi:hypothetical protein